LRCLTGHPTDFDTDEVFPFLLRHWSRQVHVENSSDNIENPESNHQNDNVICHSSTLCVKSASGTKQPFLHLRKTLCQFGGQNHQPPQLKELESAAVPFAKLLQLGLELEKFLEPSNELKPKPRQLTLVFDEITSSCAVGSLA
jgi:hypothetical protein